MNILISNDDGVFAPGLAALAQALMQIAEITVIAPDRNRSGASNSLTLDNPLRLRKLENGFMSVEGTPTDCVHLALTGLFDKKFDLIVSGINAGANLGDDVFYSGTVAAAMEGRFLGLPAIAVSLAGDDPFHYQTAAEITKQLVLHTRGNHLPAKTILNVNVPNVAFSAVKGFMTTRLGARHCAERLTPDIDRRGQTIYWIGPPGPEQDAGVGTDFYAINHHFVSITPLRLDLTDYPLLEQVEKWTTELNPMVV